MARYDAIIMGFNGGSAAVTSIAVGGLGEASPAKRRSLSMRLLQQRFGHWLLASDLGVIAAAVLLAQTIRFGQLNTHDVLRFSDMNYYIVSALIVALRMAALSINSSWPA